MEKIETLENITVEKLIFGGKGLATAPDGRKIIITGGCIPGSIISVRILKTRKSHYEAQQLDVIQASPIEIPLPAGFQLYGGAKWLTIGYEDQLQIKEGQVKESFYGILKWLDASTTGQDFSSSNTESVGLTRNDKSPMHQMLMKLPTFHPIIPSPEIYGYRNKVEFSWGKYISDREGIHDEFRFGFHAQGQFDRIIDCSYCALADAEINAIFHDVDTFSRASGFPTYDPKRAEGFWRHFVVRKGKKTGEIMLIFSVNGTWETTSSSSRAEGGETRGSVATCPPYETSEGGIQVPVMSNEVRHLAQKSEQDFSLYSKGHIQEFFTDMVRQLSEKYGNIHSIFFLENTGRADIVTGNPVLLFGQPAITDELFGLTFEIQPKSFFQVNSLCAEKLYSVVGSFLKGAVDDAGGGGGFSHGTKSPTLRAPSRQKKVLLDLYAGTGTIGILLSKYFERVYSVELVTDASADGAKNANRNGIKNVEFVNAKVEDFVSGIGSEFIMNNSQLTIIIDPPRDGMHPSALPHIVAFGAREIIYVSCNPATLARDLEFLIGKQRDEKTESLPKYRITDVTPVDMFPHTHHIETVVRMEKMD